MYRILVNGCKTYRIERRGQLGVWSLITTTDKIHLEDAILGGHRIQGGKRPLEFSSWREAMDYIAAENEKPMWKQKRETWTVVEEVPSCDD